MHLFIIDLFISIDTISPIADKLCKEEKKIFFLNSNFIQNHSFINNKLLKHLEKNKNFKLINNFNLLNIKFILSILFSKIFNIILDIFKKKVIESGNFYGYKIFHYQKDFYLI